MVKEDERGRNYIYQIEGKVREKCSVQKVPSEFNSSGIHFDAQWKFCRGVLISFSLDSLNFSQLQERELGLIMLDHSYSKPFNWRPELGFGAKPTRYLFGSNEPRSQGATSPTQV